MWINLPATWRFPSIRLSAPASRGHFYGNRGRVILGSTGLYMKKATITRVASSTRWRHIPATWRFPSIRLSAPASRGHFYGTRGRVALGITGLYMKKATITRVSSTTRWMTEIVDMVINSIFYVFHIGFRR